MCCWTTGFYWAKIATNQNGICRRNTLHIPEVNKRTLYTVLTEYRSRATASVDRWSAKSLHIHWYSTMSTDQEDHCVQEKLVSKRDSTDECLEPNTKRVCGGSNLEIVDEKSVSDSQKSQFPAKSRCSFYLPKKKRCCKTFVAEGSKYCVEHSYLLTVCRWRSAGTTGRIELLNRVELMHQSLYSTSPPPLPRGVAVKLILREITATCIPLPHASHGGQFLINSSAPMKNICRKSHCPLEIFFGNFHCYCTFPVLVWGNILVNSTTSPPAEQHDELP